MQAEDCESRRSHFPDRRDATREALRLVDDDVRKPVLPLEGEHLSLVLVVEPGLVAEFDRDLIPV